jgi:hypothetical protein
VDETSVTRYITETFDGIDTVTIPGATFFFYNPDPDVPPDHKFPFITFVTSDDFDQFSDLSRPSVFRLNIGISKQTFRSLFGSQISFSGDSYDFAALDKLMPHPVYGSMYWVCILNPGNATFETVVQPLLAEAYELVAGKHQRRAARQ